MKSHQLVVRFPPDLMAVIEENAATRGMTKTQWIRWAVRTVAISQVGGVPIQGAFTETVNYDKGPAL
jgi:hypothetical protein